MDKNKIFIIAGLGYGDEGKGTITDYIARRHNVKLIGRYNGGPQAAHFVITPENVLHCFSQFGSGTLAGAKTFLSSRVLIDPIRMLSEAQVLNEKGVNDPLDLVTIDAGCLVVTPIHSTLNQMLEISRGDAKHGSCGIGIGQAIEGSKLFGEMALVAGDLLNKETLKYKLNFLWRAKVDLAEQLMDIQPNNRLLSERLVQLKRRGFVGELISAYQDFATKVGMRIKHDEINSLDGQDIVLEGAQGVLLDKDRGFSPYITQSRTTFENADNLISRSCVGEITKIGIMRAYATRHGAGPFVTEDNQLGRQIPDHHNGTNEWQGVFRIGWFDLLSTHYALDCVGEIDNIALTNLDRLDFEKIKVCEAYEFTGTVDKSLDRFFECDRRRNGDIVIKKIIVPQVPSIEHQSRLAKLLKFCKPIYRSVKRGNYTQFLEEELKIKISIISLGPKATDKIEI